MRSRVTACLGVFGVLWLAALAAAHAETTDSIADWMVMEVCADDTGAAIPGRLPTDPSCDHKRKIKAHELPPYQLRGWPATRSGCGGDTSIKWNVPVVRNSVTRIVSVTEHGCADGDGGADDTFKGLSIQWHDDAYGFIMGSWSPVANSRFESPLCQSGPISSRRYFRGWVIAPERPPPPGVAGWGVFPGHLSVGDAPPGPCPDHYQSGLTLWIVDRMAFRGATLAAIVSHHYARADQSGAGPGQARQMERTYWTREFGLTRWEKWAREDWVHPRVHRSAAELAGRLFASGRCNAPYALPTRINGAMASQAMTTTDAYAQAIVDPRSGEKHVWYLTLCEDWTNARRTLGQDNVSETAPAIFWREP